MKQRSRYKRVAKGVYLYIKGETSKTKKNVYRVLKTVKGVTYQGYFTNKTEAIKEYNKCK